MCHTQAVIIPIIKKETDREAVMEAVSRLEAAAKTAGIRVKVSAVRVAWDTHTHTLTSGSGVAYVCISTVCKPYW